MFIMRLSCFTFHILIGLSFLETFISLICIKLVFDQFIGQLMVKRFSLLIFHEKIWKESWKLAWLFSSIQEFCSIRKFSVSDLQLLIGLRLNLWQIFMIYSIEFHFIHFVEEKKNFHSFNSFSWLLHREKKLLSNFNDQNRSWKVKEQSLNFTRNVKLNFSMNLTIRSVKSQYELTKINSKSQLVNDFQS